MRKFSLIVLLFLTLTKGYSQVATFDAKANASLIRQNTLLARQEISSSKGLAEAVMQTKYLTQTLDFWKKTEEVLKKVNNTLNTMEAVSELVNKEIMLINSCASYSKSIRKMKYLDTYEISGFITSMNDLLSTSHNLLSLASNVLSHGVFKMNDSERIQNINNITQRLNENMAMLSYNYYRARNLNQNRSLSANL
jgi:hypothetical protein